MLVCCCLLPDVSPTPAFQIHSHHIRLQFIAISASTVHASSSYQQFRARLGVQGDVFVAGLIANHQCEGLLQWSGLFSLRLNDGRDMCNLELHEFGELYIALHSLTSCSCLVIGKGRLDIFQSSNAGCHLSKHQNISEPDVSQDGNYAESLQKYSCHHSAGPLETNPELRRCPQKVLSANGSCLTFHNFFFRNLLPGLSLRMFCLRYTFWVSRVGKKVSTTIGIYTSTKTPYAGKRPALAEFMH